MRTDKSYLIFLEPEQFEALKDIKNQSGSAYAFTINKALNEYLTKQGYDVKTKI